jgi:hypothetical protein
MKILLLSFLVYYTLTTTGISGKITDKSTSEELAGVMVIVNNQDTTYTDFDGVFHFPKIDTIKTIYLKYPSYSSDDMSVIKINQLDLVKK